MKCSRFVRVVYCGHTLNAGTPPAQVEGQGLSPALQGIGLTGAARASVSAYVDDVSIFLYRSDIEVVQIALERYEKFTRAQIDYDNSSGMRLRCQKDVAPLVGLIVPYAFLESGSLAEEELFGATPKSSSGGLYLVPMAVVFQGQLCTSFPFPLWMGSCDDCVNCQI